MGAWGTAIYSDDIAMDVRDIYKEILGDGLSSEEATSAIIEMYNEEIEDEEDGPVFWISLADTQWKCGRLLESIKQKAIEIIDSGIDLEKWKEDKNDYKKRVKVLENLKMQLMSPQPPEKKMKKVFKSYNPFELYDAISYKLLSGKFTILKVISEDENNGNVSPVFEVCDWVGDNIPNIEVINELPCIRDGQGKIGMLGVRDFPKKRISVIAKNVKVVNKELGQYWHTAWKMFDEYLRRRKIL